MNRTKIAQLYADAAAFGGKTVTVAGWVKSVRDMKNFGFVTLNDGSCFNTLQVVMDRETLPEYDAIAAQNLERLRDMDLRRRLTPALLSYVGLQYQYMAPGVLEQRQYDYLQAHLRILSGFYGILRPFDGVTPYRLEMQAKLAVDGCRDLYAFWGETLAEALAAETDLVVNLASKEYSKAVEPHLPVSVRFLTCTFGEKKGGKILEKGTACKMARGQMVRWMAERGVERAEDLRDFDGLGYAFSPAHSAESNFVFLKGDT